MGRAGLLGVLLVLAGVLAAPSAHAVTSQELREVAGEQARLLLKAQGRDGSFPDPIDVRQDAVYGTPAAGYVAARTGVALGDPALKEAGLRALAHPAEQGEGDPFARWVAAIGYRWAVRTLAADDPAWAPRQATMAQWLAEPPCAPNANLRLVDRVPDPVNPDNCTGTANDCWPSTDCYHNWKLVELAGNAIAADAGAFVPDERWTKRIELVTRLAAGAKPPATKVKPAFPRLVKALSDPPHNPPAYNGFSVLHLQQVQAARPDWLPPSLQDSIGEAQRYQQALAAANGATAWVGRSQHLSWNAVQAMVTGIRSGTPEGLALADRAWSHLRLSGRRADGLLPIAPVLRSTANYRGLDSYARQGVYGGLTALLLMEAADALDATGDPALPPAGPPSGRQVDDRETSGTASETGPSSFVGVGLVNRYRDLRYATGPMEVQVRTRQGAYQPVLPARPRAKSTETLWPQVDGREPKPTANAHRLVAPGGTTVTWARRKPGLEVLVRGKPGKVVEGRLYLPPSTKRQARALRWSTGALTADQPLRTRRIGRGLPSAVDAALVQHRYRARLPRSGRLTLLLGLPR